MGTTINSYSVSLGLDSSNYIDSSKLSRTETAALKRDIAAARDPMEQLQVKQDKLTKALNEGAISQEVYNRLMQHYTDKMHAASGATEKQATLLDTFSKVGNVITGIRQGLMLVGDAVGFVADKFQAFNQVTNDLDDANDAAKKLGLSFNELGSLQFAAERLGGGDAAGAIDKALGQMLKKGMVEPGESAVDAFKRVADQVQQAATQTERAKIAADAFGKSGIEILAVLQSGSAEIENLVSQWEKTNSLSDAQLIAISEYNDQWDNVVLSVTGFRNVFVAEIAPALSVIGEDLLGMSSTFDGMVDSAEVFAETITGSAGVMKDMMQAWSFIDPRAAAARIAAGTYTVEAAMEAARFDSAGKMLAELYARRAELDVKASDEQAKRDRMRQDLEKDGIDEISDKKLEAIDKASSKLEATLDKQFQDELAREDALNAKAMSAAEKELNKKQGARPSVLSLDVGSSEYVKYMADLANSGSEVSRPTEEEILAEAVKQRELMERQAANEEAMKAKLQELIEVSKENGFKRVR